MTLTIQDLQQFQAEHPDLKMKLVNGEITPDQLIDYIDTQREQESS